MGKQVAELIMVMGIPAAAGARHCFGIARDTLNLIAHRTNTYLNSSSSQGRN
jgi:hypothetical protein